jgi:hypothetical protein
MLKTFYKSYIEFQIAFLLGHLGTGGTHALERFPGGASCAALRKFD